MDMNHGGRIFATARELGCDWREIVDFSASINPLGPAPGVRSAILDALDEIVHYPDPDGAPLQLSLAEEWAVEPESVMVGNGATELIHFAARMWNGPATLAIPVFSEFHRAFPKAAQVRVEEVWPDRGLLVYTNPVNPTGQPVELQERSGLTFVDESFLEFTDRPSCIGKALVLRSLTKFHALPGLRVGALVGPPDLMRQWRKQREPWQLNALAQAAALAALRDTMHHRKTRDFVNFERERITKELSATARVWPSVANYVMVQVSGAAFNWIRDELLREQILIRDCTGWPGVPEYCFRLAIRAREENDRLLACWRKIQCDIYSLS